METVATAARGWVIHRTVQVVAPEEPLKGAPRFIAPILFACKPIGLETSRNHGLGLHRLLVKAGTLAAAWIKTVRADRDKMASIRIRALQVGQPAERLQSGFSHFSIRDRLAA